MNTEQKAKAYDEALDRAKKELQTCGSTDCDAARQIFRFFPTLRESEDERIRARLIEYFKGFLEGYEDCYKDGGCVKWEGLDVKSILAWLEKQKENANSFTDGVIEVRSFQRGMEEGRRLEGQKEQKHPNGCFTCDEYKKGYEEGRRNGFTAGYNKAMKEVEQKEQKPAQSEEEKEYVRTLKGLVSDFIRDSGGGITDVEYYQNICDWLDGRHIEQKPVVTHGETYHVDTLGTQQVIAGKMPQKPAEWSEEDEEISKRIIADLRWGRRNTVSDKDIRQYDEEINWMENRLKSLRPQSHKEIYQATKHDLAIKFMNYLDENRPEGKMSLSNAECEDIDKAFKENDWEKILKYSEKYGK